MMRVRFFDPQITFDGDRAASVAVTAEVTTETDSGKDLIDVHHVTAIVRKSDERWVVWSARIAEKAGA